jgi:hypothetical protein
VRKFRATLSVLYWLAVAYVSIALFREVADIEAQLGCPAQGDCYEPGAEHLFWFHIIAVYAALLLIPLAAWKIYRVFASKQVGNDT